LARKRSSTHSIKHVILRHGALKPQDQQILQLKSYVQIQQIRFRPFSFELDIDADFLDVGVLNHMLQPLLENAIIHGIEPYSGMYEISITG
jgi:two-component system sensor histidine kinase YesM